MDLGTHALVGLTLYQTRRSRYQQYDPALFWAALIGSEMPDFDIVYQIESSMTYLLNHRGITHSLPGVFIMAAGLAYLLQLRYPNHSLRRLFTWSTLAGLVHVALDALNTWGTKALYPFSERWITLDILPFIDIPLLLCCGFSLLGGYLNPLKARRYALCAIAIFVVYLGGRGMLHQHLLQQLHLQYTSTPIQKISVLPTIHPLKWHAVIETKSSVEIGNIYAMDGYMYCTAWYPVSEDPMLAQIREDYVVSETLPFFRYPSLKIQQDAGKSVVVISDLYFATSAQRRATFELRTDGTIKRSNQKLLQNMPLVQ
jgi:inner membrane protein